MDVESRASSSPPPDAAADAAVDWRGRPCEPRRHGGMRAAVFVLGIQAFEIMAIAAVGNNLITYVFGEMHFPLSQAANVVTNFVGTIFLLSLLGGFLSDSYLGCFWTMLIFGFVELSGFILLSVQAHLPQLKPPPCNMAATDGGCEQARGIKASIFFAALYLVALGSGCLKPNMIAHGADQFAAAAGGGGAAAADNAKRLSTYFNSAYFSFCAGELVALTALVWVQTHSGMDVGFGISAAAMAAGLVSLVSGAAFYRNKPPQGSIFTPIARVFVAAYTKRKQICPSSSSDPVNAGVCEPAHLAGGSFRHASKFRFLDKACIRAAEQGPNTKPESPWRLCTAAEVRQAKTLLAVAPIFACTIVFNTVLAQLQTFSVQQGSAMDTALGGAGSSFRIPPASLQAIPYAMLLALVPAYELLLVPLMRRATGARSGITPLQRIGVGLCTVPLSMVAAATVEHRRRDLSLSAGGAPPRAMSVLWIVPQFLVFGVSEMFTAVGLIEFFYKQARGAGMQSFLTALTYCSYAFGFYLSSVLVSLVNRVTASRGGGGHGGWLGDNDLDKDRLDLFYWMLAVLSVINFFCYLLCARWYNSGGADDGCDASASAQVAAEGDGNGKEII
uniref:Major facilitator superfamily (MFS) profile domain-containing protein n=1 Tax=Oryza rufipogon TaxID=4529 RepID=A0A0E0P9K3_ORYRU